MPIAQPAEFQPRERGSGPARAKRLQPQEIRCRRSGNVDAFAHTAYMDTNRTDRAAAPPINKGT